MGRAAPTPKAEAGSSVCSAEASPSGDASEVPLRIVLSDPVDPASYRVAERWINSTSKIRSLRSFEVSGEIGEREWQDPLPTSLEPSGPPGSSIFLAGRRRSFWRQITPGNLVFHFAGLGTLRVAADGNLIDARGLRSGLPRAVVEEVVLGPGLVLCLATRGVWSPHASAVAVESGAVLFLGDSGSGKSTLAAFLADQGHRLLADDVLPVELAERSVEALVAFPQLKLPQKDQPGAAVEARRPVAAICVLNPAADAFGCRQIAGAEAIGLLVRHTVAARLFHRPLLRSHLDGCVQLAQRLPVFVVDYPHRPESLERVHRFLVQM